MLSNKSNPERIRTCRYILGEIFYNEEDHLSIGRAIQHAIFVYLDAHIGVLSHERVEQVLAGMRFQQTSFFNR